MRWNEREADDKKEKEPREREIPLSKPGETDWDQLETSKNRPFLGGNYNA